MRIESLLSARLFLSPQWAGDHLYFLSNLSGHISLYKMRIEGGVPQPLLPPNIALPNPDLLGGASFRVYPSLGKILVMIDSDGDEVYRPYLIPLDGDFPEPLLPEQFIDQRAHCVEADEDANTAIFLCESETSPLQKTFMIHLDSLQVTEIGQSEWGYFPLATSDDKTLIALGEGYTNGDTILLLWKRDSGIRNLYGTVLDDRTPDQVIPLTGFGHGEFDAGGLLISSCLYEDSFGLVYFSLDSDEAPKQVAITGAAHSGTGKLETISHMNGNRYLVQYNIDGATWLYEATFDPTALKVTLGKPLVGTGALANGKLEAAHYSRAEDHCALSFSSATSPTQIYTIANQALKRHTDERILGIDPALLATGEDASFVSYDGLRTSARLYLPAASLGYEAPYPLVYYVHGGPQSQERPDFAWFSMPLIQFLTLNGFAVFVPNVRGSTGYGISYSKYVDHDWGGRDRLDHVHAMGLLAQDPRIDTRRAAVVGRSYGGYMTLTLASRHPELWSAAVDMFGPYNLLTFSERIPETWKPYFAEALGDVVKDRDFLIERSPSTHIQNITCPLLVIQGANDPRVVLSESRDAVDKLRQTGHDVDLLVFEDEGHDVLKFKNRVTCYNAITAFFKQHLQS